MYSKITGGPTEVLFTAKVLNKYTVTYYKCVETGFIQTEEPYWLEEAYSSAITKLDVGLVSRNEMLRNRTLRIIASCFDGGKKFLDYAGGYGMFTRMMRDKGYDFYHSDIYCQNIFAEYFDLSDCSQQKNFELVTAFEVFEHMASPLEGIKDIAEFGENILFTTELQPANLKDVTDWWYFVPETGQHIALHTKSSLDAIAKKLGFHFYTDGTTTHLFTRTKLSFDPFKSSKEPYLIRSLRRKLSRYDRRTIERESLLLKDFDQILKKLQ